MRKAALCICENKDADQLRGNREADQRLCFRHTHSTNSILPKYEISSLCIFCGCTARFVSDQVRNPEDWFSQNEAQIKVVFSPEEMSQKVKTHNDTLNSGLMM